MQPSDSVHKITSLPRGRVLVLNYEKFETAKFRNGAVWDAKKLDNLFNEVSHLHFSFRGCLPCIGAAAPGGIKCGTQSRTQRPSGD